MLSSDIPISLRFHRMASGVTYDAQGIDLDNQAVGDLGWFDIPFKCEVYYAAVTITESFTGTVPTGEIKYDSRPTAGSDTGRNDGDIADLKLNTGGVTAAGDTCYDLAAIGTTLEPGQQVVVQLISTPKNGGATGHIDMPMLVVKYIPETFANLSNMQATA